MEHSVFQDDPKNMFKNQRFAVFSFCETDDNIIMFNIRGVAENEENAQGICAKIAKYERYHDLNYINVGKWFPIGTEFCKKKFENEKQQEFYEHQEKRIKEKKERDEKERQELKEFWDTAKDRENDLKYLVNKVNEGIERRLHEEESKNMTIKSLNDFISSKYKKIIPKRSEIFKDIYSEMATKKLNHCETRVEQFCRLVVLNKGEKGLVDESAFEYKFMYE